MKRLSIALRCFFSLLLTGTLSERLLAELRARVAPGADPVPAAPAAGGATQAPGPGRTVSDARTDGAVQMLALLQRDGRLIDFFTEDIAEYDDAQVGAAVRDMHVSCGETLKRYLTFEPVVTGEEGKPITIDSPFAPGTIKLIGRVTGSLPVRGVLRHHGWRVGTTRLPDLPGSEARSIVAPAEIEVPESS